MAARSSPTPLATEAQFTVSGGRCLANDAYGRERWVEGLLRMDEVNVALFDIVRIADAQVVDPGGAGGGDHRPDVATGAHDRRVWFLSARSH